ncbi:flavin reductase family protein [Aeromicrobium sp. Leaf350]|uniref:flavin reductase family protein n=1 Tax=Aeromicrobium sp. Leaf350 TaxID=2876565 RepID=UPI001E3AA322|nr:flavin reductase family protein [Aeromicrobium sp. Leaf350]
MHQFDPLELRVALRNWPTGVSVITTTHEDQPVGVVVGSFSSVSLAPPLVGFFVGQTSTTWPSIEQSGTFCVNVLSSSQTGLVQMFGKPAASRFDEIRYSASSLGDPVIVGCVASIGCRIEDVTDAGDHFFVTGRVVDVATDPLQQPLLFVHGGFSKPRALGQANPELPCASVSELADLSQLILN